LYGYAIFGPTDNVFIAVARLFGLASVLKSSYCWEIDEFSAHVGLDIWIL
jgi:hypothetical protein